MEGTIWLCMDCQEEFYEPHDKCPDCGENMSPDAKVPAGAIYGVYQIRTTCQRCGQPMPLNGPLREVDCKACGNTSHFPPEQWKSLLEDLVEEYDEFGWSDSRGSTLMSGASTFKNTYGRQVPHCPDCHKVLPAFDIPVGDNRDLTCRKCGMLVPTSPAPEWLVEVLPSARQLYGAEREAGSAPTGSVEAEVSEAARPVVMQCPQCGGALKVTVESDRLVPCEYCNVDVYLPDDVWRRLHPVKTTDRWMIRFEGNPRRLRDEKTPEDEDTEGDDLSPGSTPARWLVPLLLAMAALAAGLFFLFFANNSR